MREGYGGDIRGLPCKPSPAGDPTEVNPELVAESIQFVVREASGFRDTKTCTFSLSFVAYCEVTTGQ